MPWDAVPPTGVGSVKSLEVVKGSSPSPARIRLQPALFAYLRSEVLSLTGKSFP